MLDFVQAFVDYNSAYESPTDFFTWSALAGVSALLRDNCYLLLGDTKLFPNIYILIIAKPAMRKAKPLNSIIELVKPAKNTKIIEGRTSIQAVIQRLGETDRLKDGRTIPGASGIIFSEEISAMFTDDEATIPVLTDLYDFKSTYTSALVSRATVTLTNVVVTMLGASNEELIRPVFNNKAIYGGLLSRCLIVYGDRVRHRNSLMFEGSAKYDPKELQEVVGEIAKLKGVFSITQDARAHYNDWYLNVCPTLEEYGSKTGAEGRIHTNILKVAMLLAVAKNRALKIDVPILEDAISKCQALFNNYRRLTMGSGKSKDVEPTVQLLKVLWESPGYTLTRQDVMYRCWSDMSAETLDGVVRTLMEGGLVEVTEEKTGSRFKLTDKSVAYFTNKIPKKV